MPTTVAVCATERPPPAGDVNTVTCAVPGAATSAAVEWKPNSVVMRASFLFLPNPNRPIPGMMTTEGFESRSIGESGQFGVDVVGDEGDLAPQRRDADGERKCEPERDEDAGDPVQLRAGEEAEDDEQRVEPQRVRHHVRDDDVALDLVDEDEERRHPEERDRVDDQRVDRGRHRREPGADVRDHLDHRCPEPEQEGVPLGSLDEARPRFDKAEAWINTGALLARMNFASQLATNQRFALRERARGAAESPEALLEFARGIARNSQRSATRALTISSISRTAVRDGSDSSGRRPLATRLATANVASARPMACSRADPAISEIRLEISVMARAVTNTTGMRA